MALTIVLQHILKISYNFISLPVILGMTSPYACLALCNTSPQRRSRTSLERTFVPIRGTVTLSNYLLFGFDPQLVKVYNLLVETVGTHHEPRLIELNPI